MLRIASDIHQKINDNRKQFVHVVQNLDKKRNDLDSRVVSLEDWSRRARNELKKMAENNEKMYSDIQKLGSSLNGLHALLKKKQQQQMIFALVGVARSLIPILGPALASAAQAAGDIFLGMEFPDMLEVGAGRCGKFGKPRFKVSKLMLLLSAM